MKTQFTGHGALNKRRAKNNRLLLSGDTLFAVTPAGLAIGQLTRGSAPSVSRLAAYGNPGTVRDVAVLGNLAVVALGPDGLDVLDVAQPFNPQRLGHLNGVFLHLAAGGGQVFVSVGSDLASQSLDLANPAQPVLGRSWSSNGFPLCGHGRGAFLANGQGLNVISRDATGPFSSFTLSVGESIAAAELDGDAYLVGTGFSLQLWENVTPAYNVPPIRTGSIPVPGGVRSLVAAGGLAYLASGDGTLRIADIREPRTPRLVGAQPLDASALVLSGGLLLASTPAGLVILPVQDPGTGGSAAVGTAGLPDQAMGLTAYREGLLVANAVFGVSQVDLMSPSTPALTSKQITGADVRQVEHLGRDIYLLDGTSLKIASEQTGTTAAPSFSSPSAPTKINPGVTRFALSPHRIWITDGGKVHTAALPLSDSSIVGSVAPGGSILDLSGDEGRAVAALGDAGFAVITLDPSGSPAAGPVVAPYSANAVALDGARLVTGYKNQLAFYDLSSGALLPAKVVATSGPVQRIRLTGQLAVVSEGSAVELWDLSGPTLLATYPAQAARDAVIASNLIAVADAGNVVLYPLPLQVPAPSVHFVLPAVDVEAERGSALLLEASASGLGLDEVELLVDGTPHARLDDGRPMGVWNVPSTAVPGTTVHLQLRARSAGDRQALSPPRSVRISDTHSVAPTVVSFSGPNLNQRSGANVTFTATISGGLAPFSAFARYVLPSGTDGASDEIPLGSVPVTGTQINGSLRLPVVAMDTSGTLVLDVIDGAGRLTSASCPLMLTADTTPPAQPNGLPAKLRASPYVNTLWLGSNDVGVVWLVLEKDGVTLASTQEVQDGVSLVYALVLPEAVGTQVTLRVIATDGAGRQSISSKTYTVLPDGDPPVVSFNTDGQPPASAREGTNVTVRAEASDPDNDLDSLVLLADGVEVGHTSQPPLSVTYTVPTLGPSTTVHFEAVGTDSRRRTGSATRDMAISANAVPAVLLSAPESAVEGTTIKVSADATDDSSDLRSLALLVNGVEASSSVDSSSDHSSLWHEWTVVVPARATADTVALEVVAMDSLGRSGRATALVAVTPREPPTVSIGAPGRAVEGSTIIVEVSASGQYGDLRSLVLSADGVEVNRSDTPYDLPSLKGKWQVTVPSRSTAMVLHLSATATDSAGKTGEATADVTIDPSSPPSISLSAPSSAVELTQVPVGANAWDPDGDLVSLVVTANGTVLDGTLDVYSNGLDFSSNYVFPSVDAQLVHFRAKATDRFGNVAVQEAITTVTLPPTIPPPSLRIFAPGGTPLIAGYSEKICVDAWSDSSSITSISINLGSGPISGDFEYCNESTGAPGNCTQICADATVTDTTLTVTAMAQDGAGLSGSAIRAFPVVANKPPTVELGHDDYLVDQAPAKLVLSANDERIPAHLELRIAGEIVPATDNGGSLSATYTPPAGSTRVDVVGSARDGAGVTTTQSWSIPVLPAGSGASCNQPVPLSIQGETRLADMTQAPPVSACGQTVAKGVWVSLPFDGPIESLWIGGQHLQQLSIQEGCAATPQSTCSTSIQAGQLSGDTRIFVAPQYDYWDDTLYMGGRLGTGARCDPTSRAFLCTTPDACKRNTSGEFRCAPAACADGNDNDGDQLFDWPDDPGCSWPGDDDEADPATPPACAAARDTNGDGRIDTPSDATSCGAASGDRLDFCATPIAGVLSKLPLPIAIGARTTGATDSQSSTSGAGAGTPDHVYEWTAPMTAVYQVDVTGDRSTPLLIIRDGACTGPETGTTDSGWSVLSLAAGQTLSVAVDFTDPAETGYVLSIRMLAAALPFGSACDPASFGVFCLNGVCDLDATTGQHLCRPAACFDQTEAGNDHVRWPWNSSCTWPGSDHVVLPASAPACHDGKDNDGDGLFDYPNDLQCGSASSLSESFCSQPIDGALGNEPLPFSIISSTVGGTSAIEGPSCSGSTGPVRVFQFTAPSTGIYHFQVDGPLGPLMAVRDGMCSGPELACDWEARLSLNAGQTVALVVRGSSGAGEPFQLSAELLYGLVRPGEICNPESTTAACEFGTCAPNAVGVPTCPAAACSDHIDNDGDKLIDWPNDPGCSWPGSNSEADSPTAPACHDGLDNDGDTLRDYPQDPKCWMASSDSEAFCTTRFDGVLRLDEPAIQWSTLGGPLSPPVVAEYGSDLGGQPSRTFQFTAPQSGNYVFTTAGAPHEEWTSTVLLTARDGMCDGPVLGASNVNLEVPEAMLWLPLNAGQTIALSVSGGNDLGQFVLGAYRQQ